jgi:hypothetical protein
MMRRGVKFPKFLISAESREKKRLSSESGREWLDLKRLTVIFHGQAFQLEPLSSTGYGHNRSRMNEQIRLKNGLWVGGEEWRGREWTRNF